MKLFERIQNNARKIENLRAIKEALDTLPNGIAYFEPSGAVKLYNRQMIVLYHILARQELQDLEELRETLEKLDSKSSVSVISDAPRLYRFPDHSIWKYSESKIDMGRGIFYTEVVFSEVTEIYNKGLELKSQAKELQKIALQLKQLSEGMLVMTKEEEILAAKTRLHDDMGAALLAAKQSFAHPEQKESAQSAVAMFRKAVSAIKNDNSYEVERDSMAELMQDAKTIGMTLQMEGELPENKEVSTVFINALRECMTNALRHSKADRLQIQVTKDDVEYRLVITNNGLPPTEEIVPRGGLLNLWHRVTNLNGVMEIQSFPIVELKIIIPIRKEDT